MPRLRLDPAIIECFPGYNALIVYAHDLTNGPCDDGSVAVLRTAELGARVAFGGEKTSGHPHIAAWRQAYAAFGAKPGRFPCSVEALLDRTLKGRDLPAINRIVDRYNAVSLEHILPVGGEDLDRLTGDLLLTVAAGTEAWDTPQEGQPVVQHPEPGEIIWLFRSFRASRSTISVVAARCGQRKEGSAAGVQSGWGAGEAGRHRWRGGHG